MFLSGRNTNGAKRAIRVNRKSPQSEPDNGNFHSKHSTRSSAIQFLELPRRANWVLAVPVQVQSPEHHDRPSRHRRAFPRHQSLDRQLTADALRLPRLSGAVVRNVGTDRKLTMMPWACRLRSARRAACHQRPKHFLTALARLTDHLCEIAPFMSTAQNPKVSGCSPEPPVSGLATPVAGGAIVGHVSNEAHICETQRVQLTCPPTS